ncbi:hypothetical protein ACX0G9_20820 [Flavitalea flava]
MDIVNYFLRILISKLIPALPLVILFQLPAKKSAAQDRPVKTANIGIVYPISSNGTRAKEYTNNFSLNTIVGVSGSENGLSLSGLSTIILHNAAGLQMAGFSNHIYDSAQGVQLAGFLNYIKNNSSGVQAAGFINITGSSTGLNIAGFGNIAHRDASGIQVAGFINKAANSGIQVAGFINKAAIAGNQVSGFMNIAKKVKGVQVGFINIADSNECPIGIVNLIKNGEKTIGISTDETLTTLITFRSGGRKLYGIAGLGYNNKGNRKLAAWEAGIGAHVRIIQTLRLNFELVNIGLTDFKNGDYLKSTIRIMPALRLTPGIEVFGGPNFNYIYSNKGQGSDLVSHYLWSEKKNSDLHGLYFGFTAGFHVKI